MGSCRLESGASQRGRRTWQRNGLKSPLWRREGHGDTELSFDLNKGMVVSMANFADNDVITIAYNDVWGEGRSQRRLPVDVLVWFLAKVATPTKNSGR